MLDLVGREPVPQIFLVHGDAVGDRPAGQVVVEPVHVPAGIGHSRTVAKGLGDVKHPFFIDAEGDRIGQQRLGREQLDVQTFRHAERSDRLDGLIGGGSNCWVVRFGLGGGAGGFGLVASIGGRWTGHDDRGKHTRMKHLLRSMDILTVT